MQAQWLTQSILFLHPPQYLMFSVFIHLSIISWQQALGQFCFSEASHDIQCHSSLSMSTSFCWGNAQMRFIEMLPWYEHCIWLCIVPLYESSIGIQSQGTSLKLYMEQAYKFIFFGGSKLLLPGSRPDSKTKFLVAKLCVNFFVGATCCRGRIGV